MLIPSPPPTQPVRDLLTRTLRCLLTQESLENEGKGDLRLALRAVCVRARGEGLSVEKLLLTLKDVWYDLPERRQLPRVGSDISLTRLVTACIDEYFQGPRLGSEGVRGRAVIKTSIRPELSPSARRSFIETNSETPNDTPEVLGPECLGPQ